MYNLLVAFDKNAWGEGLIELGVSRCVNEYTEESFIKQFGSFDEKSIGELRRFPCIFAYETLHAKDPLFGRITAIKRNANLVKIEFELIALEKFLTHHDLEAMSPSLDIGNLELHRTHWAVKDVDLFGLLAVRAIVLPDWAKKKKKIVDIQKHKFQVALSFPGEIRPRIKEIIVDLERELGPDSYFYDDNYQAQLAQPNLDILLQDI